MLRGFGLGLGLSLALALGGVDPSAVDVTAPTVVSTTLGANGLTLTIVYGELLDTNSTPATSAFTVSATEGARTVSSVLVTGSSVVLTLAAVIYTHETVTLTYVVPGSNKVQDQASNAAAAYAAAAVTNSSAQADASLPTVTGRALATNGLTLTITYSEVLDTGSTPATSAYAVVGSISGAFTVSAVNVTGATAVLTLGAAAYTDETLTVAYTAPGTGKVRDTASNNAASFGAAAVTNGSTVGNYDISAEAGVVAHWSLLDSVVTLSSASLTTGTDLSDASWTKTAATVTTNVAGTQDRLVVTGPSPNALATVANAGAGTTPVPLTTTFWASYESVQWVQLETRNATAGNQVWFDVQNGVVGTTGANLASASIQAETRNGVAGYRCSVKTIAQGSTHIVRLTLSTTNTTITNPANATSTRFDDVTVSQIRCSAITNKKTGVTIAQATADLQPGYDATGLNGGPCLIGDGVRYLLGSEASVLLANAAAYTLFCVGSITSTATLQAFFGYGDSGQATARTRAWGNDSTAKWLTQTRNDANANLAVDSTAASDTSPHVLEWASSGAVFDLQKDGAAADPARAGTGALNPGTLTPARYGIMCRPSSTVGLALVGKWASTTEFSTDASATIRGRVRRKLGLQWGITVS